MNAASTASLDVAAYRTITVTPIAGSIGAEIGDVDLSADLDDEVVAEIRRAWLEHLVVFFRDQPLECDRFLAVARRFGTPVEYPFVPGLDGYPEIIAVTKLPSETVNFGGIWHSDTAYLQEPPMATMLLAREVPPAGGDTLFANMYAAYEALSPAMQDVLAPLRAVNSSALADVSKTREDRIRDGGSADAVTEYEAPHPVVRTHPETGRKALYVNVAHTARFEGMTEEESRPLLQFLFQHQVRPEFTCRFQWRVGSLTMWDNRCAQHYPINDYHGWKRVMHRITMPAVTQTRVRSVVPTGAPSKLPVHVPVQLSLRYDLRAPSFGAPPAELYAAALEQCAWAEAHGFSMVALSEHHGVDDGYCPSPLVMAAAIAGRTRSLRMVVTALVLPLYDPVRLAEDLAVLDLASGGRVDVVVGAGYLPQELAMFGKEMSDRLPLVEEGIRVLRAAWTGEEFEYAGRRVRRDAPSGPPTWPRPADGWIDSGGSPPRGAPR